MHDLGIHDEPYVLLLPGKELRFGLFLLEFGGMAEESFYCTLALLLGNMAVKKRG